MPAAFVTGATGFLGSHLVDRLLEKKWEVHVLVRRRSNLRWLLGKKVHYHYGDVVGDARGLKEGLKQADICFHLAGVIVARRPSIYYEVNAQGTANLLHTCLKEHPKIGRVVVVTSLAAHGPNPNQALATEEDDCHPLTDYGRSKRDAELITLRYSDRLPVTIVRPPAIYGPRDQQFARLFWLARRGIVPSVGSGRGLVNVTFVQDVVSGILLAAEAEKGVGEIFFIGDKRNYRWDEAAAIIAKSVRKRYWRVPVPRSLLIGFAGALEGLARILPWTPPITVDQATNFVQNNWSLDISKAAKYLGYSPSYDLKKGADMAAAWYLEEGWI